MIITIKGRIIPQKRNVVNQDEKRTQYMSTICSDISRLYMQR